LPFHEIDLDLNVGICKIYSHLLYGLIHATYGANNLKKLYYNFQLFSKFKQLKIEKILKVENLKYLEMREKNHVKETWNKLRKKENIEFRLQKMFESRQQYQEMVNYQLEWIPRYGWDEKLDDHGYSFWEEKKTKIVIYTTPPRYTIKEWYDILKIQNLIFKFLFKISEKKKLKEIEKEKAILEQEKLLREQFKSTQSSLTFHISITKSLINSILKNNNIKYRGVGGGKSVAKKIISNTKIVTPPSLETFLPYKYQFISTDIFLPQEWVLLNLNLLQSVVIPSTLTIPSSTERSTELSTEPSTDLRRSTSSSSSSFSSSYKNYKIVLILKYNSTKFKYDIRLKSGVIMKGIPSQALSKYNYDIGSRVEVRYKGGTLFYSGSILSIQRSNTSTNTSGGGGENVVYNIRYVDGEKEVCVPRNMIRPSENGMKEFFVEREKLLKHFELRQKRSIFYRTMREEREHTRREQLQV
jgi:hypothetical protein